MKDEKSRLIDLNATDAMRAASVSSFILHPSSFLVVVIVIVAGCAHSPEDTCRTAAHSIILAEQRTIDFHDPAPLPPSPAPDTLPPRTVSEPQPDTAEWRLSLDDAIRIALERARVVRVLTGVTANASGQTVYDTAIINTNIDQAQARFDPNLSQTNSWSRTNTPFGIPDPNDPTRSGISSTPTDAYLSTLGVTKTNVIGGQWALTWNQNPMRFTTPVSPLNPQDPSNVSLSYTQPLLQGAGYQVNMAPIVIARLNTEQSYFQYKDSVQELVRGVIEGYWNLVQARTDAWARQIQVDQAKSAYDREKARLDAELADASNVAQARVTYNQFNANLIAAKAAVLAREGGLRNLLGLPPSDQRQIIPTSVPTNVRLRPDWKAVVRLAEERRPDVVELKLVTDADRMRLLQAENQALPRVDAVALYRWNGLSGTMPNGASIATAPGQFTDWSVGVNFSVPLGLRTERAKVRQQKLIIERDLANVDQELHQAAHELASTVRDLDSAYEQYQAYKETRVAAEINVRVQNAQFKAGRVIYLTVLQALIDWGNAITAEAQQLLTYNVTLANLERQTGTILETHGLVFAEERFRAAGPLLLPCADRDYPEALVPVGGSKRYPGTSKPSEEAFDLANPAPREPRGPDLPPADLPLPRPLLEKP